MENLIAGLLSEKNKVNSAQKSARKENILSLAESPSSSILVQVISFLVPQ